MNWLAFLNRYKLHGILCDGILSELLYEPVSASCHVLINEKLCHSLSFGGQVYESVIKEWQQERYRMSRRKGGIGGGGGPMFTYNPVSV